MSPSAKATVTGLDKEVRLSAVRCRSIGADKVLMGEIVADGDAGVPQRPLVGMAPHPYGTQPASSESAAATTGLSRRLTSCVVMLHRGRSWPPRIMSITVGMPAAAKPLARS